MTLHPPVLRRIGLVVPSSNTLRAMNGGAGEAAESLCETEAALGLPVVSAATASVWALLRALVEKPDIRAAGSLLRSARQAEEALA